jgi:hypothetical protein
MERTGIKVFHTISNWPCHTHRFAFHIPANRAIRIASEPIDAMLGFKILTDISHPPSVIEFALQISVLFLSFSKCTLGTKN